MAKDMFLSMLCRKFTSSCNLSVMLATMFMVLMGLGSGSAYSTYRIVGGSEVSSDAVYPWMVSLRDAATGEHVCGGTLVHSRWVLSASHCFYGEPAEAISVYVGDYDISRIEETEQRISVINRVESERDLMLLELAVAVDSEVYPPVKLVSPAVMDSLAVGDHLQAVGWGDTNPLGNSVSEETGELLLNEEYPDTLREVSLPLFNRSDCARSKGNGNLESYFGEDDYLPIYGETIDEKHLCVGLSELPEQLDTGQDICSGDSGGPLLVQSLDEWYQVGVASFGSMPCAQINDPSVFTKVTEFKSWIEEIIYAADLVLDSSSLPTDLTISVLEEGQNPVCSETALRYKLKDENTYSIRFLNRSDESITIDKVAFDVDEEVVTCGGEDRTYISSELSISAASDDKRCQGATLAPDEECEVALTVNFTSPGIKSAMLDLAYADGAKTSSLEVNFNAIGEAEFSSIFGDEIFFFMEKHNEWEFQSDAVSSLVSDFSLYDNPALVAKVDGGGQFSFDWRIGEIDVVELSLWVNGEELTEYQPKEAYSRETLVLPDGQVNTVMWRMAKGSNYIAAAGSGKPRTAHLKSVSFVSNNPKPVDEPVVEQSSSNSSSSSGGALNPLLLLFFGVFSLLRRGLGFSRMFLVVLFVALGFSGLSHAENRIVGGSDAEARSYPWMVSLQNKFTGEHYCGGTLVDEYYVLTASHCYRDEALDSIVAVIGANNIGVSTGYQLEENSNARAVGVVEYLNNGEGADFLLFQLAEAVDIESIALATEADMRRIGEGDTLKILGWGDTDPSEGVQTYPDVLQEADVNLLNLEACQESYVSIEEHEVSDDMLCAGLPQGGRDACLGDSGGPLLWQNEFGEWVQIGVTAFGEGCGLAEYPGVYTRVSSFIELYEEALEWSDIVISPQYLGSITQGSTQTYQLDVTSNLVQPFEITWVSIDSGDSAGFKVVGDRCSNDILYSGDTCSVDLKVGFDEEGEKSSQLMLSLADDSSKSYRISTRIYPQAALVVEGSGLSFLAESSSVWRNGEAGDLLVDMPDDQKVSRFGAYLSQAGALSFNWRLMSSDIMNLDVYVDGSRVVFESEDEEGLTQVLTPDNTTKLVSVAVPEGGAYVEWVLARKRGATLTGSNTGDDASVANIQFSSQQADLGEEDNSESDKSSSGGGAPIHFIAILLVLMTVVRSRLTK